MDDSVRQLRLGLSLQTRTYTLSIPCALCNSSVRMVPDSQPKASTRCRGVAASAVKMRMRRALDITCPTTGRAVSANVPDSNARGSLWNTKYRVRPLVRDPRHQSSFVVLLWRKGSRAGSRVKHSIPCVCLHLRQPLMQVIVGLCQTRLASRLPVS